MVDGRALTCPRLIYSKQLSRGQHWYSANADWVYYMGVHRCTHCRHLANMTELSVCGGDAALHQITLITCSRWWWSTILDCHKYQLSLTNPCDTLHHRKRAANKCGRSVWTSGYATMVHGRGCNPHRCMTTFATWKLHYYDVIDDVISRKLYEIDKNGDHTAAWNRLSYPMVKTASLYDNFCKTGNDVIDDIIIWVQDGNCKKWLERILVFVRCTI